MIFILTTLTIYLNFHATLKAGGITYSFPKKSTVGMMKNSQSILVKKNS